MTTHNNRPPNRIWVPGCRVSCCLKSKGAANSTPPFARRCPVARYRALLPASKIVVRRPVCNECTMIWPLSQRSGSGTSLLATLEQQQTVRQHLGMRRDLVVFHAQEQLRACPRSATHAECFPVMSANTMPSGPQSRPVVSPSGEQIVTRSESASDGDPLDRHVETSLRGCAGRGSEKTLRRCRPARRRDRTARWRQACHCRDWFASDLTLREGTSDRSRRTRFWTHPVTLPERSAR